MSKFIPNTIFNEFCSKRTEKSKCRHFFTHTNMNKGSALNLWSLRATTSPPCFHDTHLPAVELWGHFLLDPQDWNVGLYKQENAKENKAVRWWVLVPPLTRFDTLFPCSAREKEFIQTAYTHIHTHCQVQQPLLVTPWQCSQRICTHTPACLEREDFRKEPVDAVARVCVVCLSISYP